MNTAFDLFAQTTRPDPALFFRRDEPGDPRLGEVVRWQPADYASAQFMLLGCPQDEGVRRNGGRVGAAAAPNAIRHWLYRLVAPDGIRLFDLGNTIIQPTLEETDDLQQQIVHQIIADGKTLISLGGGNDLSYPDCAGLAQVESDVLAFNVDAHLDVRANPVRNSGTPYRVLLEEGHLLPEKFYEMAYQPFAVAESHLRYLHDQGATTHSLRGLHERGLLNVFRLILEETPSHAIFWGIDLDSVRISDAPGVSAPNPLGMSGDELCQIAELAGRSPRTKLIEFTEVNPTYDIDGRTCRLAAVAIWHFLWEAAT
jgi:formiminoglutamase